MAKEMMAQNDNPVIHQGGEAKFGKNHYCKWKTGDGGQSVIILQNSGSNTLTITVSGAPSSILTIDGTPLVGIHTLPPNEPTTNITAMGDFLGQTVYVYNISALATDCSEAAQYFS